MPRALTDAEKRAHAELAHGRHVENLDHDAELSQARCPARKFAGIEHICRLVDEIACPDNAVGDTLRVCPCFLSRRRTGAGEVDLPLVRSLVAFLPLCLVAIEAVCAQARAEHEIGDLVGLQRPRAEFRHYRRLRGGAWDTSHGDAAKLDQVAILEVALLAGADDDQARYVETGRRNDLERRSVFTGEAIRGRGAPMQIADRGQCLLRGGPEFEAFRAERNENPPQTIV